MNLKYDFSIQEVADKFVAIAKNRETGTVELVFSLNGTGALMLQAIQEGKDVGEIAGALASEYDIQPEDAKKEVSGFMAMLLENGIASA